MGGAFSHEGRQANEDWRVSSEKWKMEIEEENKALVGQGKKSKTISSKSGGPLRMARRLFRAIFLFLCAKINVIFKYWQQSVFIAILIGNQMNSDYHNFITWTLN